MPCLFRERLTRVAIIIEDALRNSGLRVVDWAPDGRSVTFFVEEKGASSDWSQPPPGGPPKQLTDFETSRILSLAWSPDGKHLAFVRTPPSTSDAVLISNFMGSEK